VENQEQRQLWYEYIDRYHYLGYQLPFGAQLRYFIKAQASGDILGCFQFSSPAWKMAPRDRLGDQARKANLQKIFNNSRVLILPWVEVKNLASSALCQATGSVVEDWQRCYGSRPVLIETLLDRSRFSGTIYRAANWVHIGQTTGRGRMDRDHARQGVAVKAIYVYPPVFNPPSIKRPQGEERSRKKMDSPSGKENSRRFWQAGQVPWLRLDRYDRIVIAMDQ
jgi:hypothetical protein